MSRVFNDTSNLSGLVQRYEKAIGANYGDVSGSTEKLKEFTSLTRSAFDTYLHFAFKGEGSWQYDDTNHQDGSGNYTYSIIKTNLVSGQRDYTFLTDEQGNVILDIYKVLVLPSATATEYVELAPMDEMLEHDNDIVAESAATGTPRRYGKMTNAIQFETPTNYNATNGLKVYVNREASYFATSDTTKKPGVPGIHHDYFFLRPAMEYARDNLLASFPLLRDAVMEYEGNEENGVIGKIERHFSRRRKDERDIITGKRKLYI